MANIEKISSVVQNEKIVEKINELADGVNSSLKEAPVLSVNGQTGEVQITRVENADNADMLGGKSSSEFATAEQGNKADTALQAGDVTKQTVGLGNVANERQYSAENPPPYPVVTVAGKTGAVSLVKNDVGLNNVDNTSDLDKPVSTAQSVAIADAKKAGTDALDVANSKYEKPNDGIPKADLDVGVQASLSKADTALQKAPVTSVNGATGAVQIDVPTKLSELTNDKGFITATVNNLTNYYTKTLTYTKTEVDNLLSAIPKFGVSVVDSLPTTGISSTTVYLITNTAPDDSNLYDEYIYVLGKWEKLGTAKIDLSNYVTVTQLNSALASYATKTEVGAKYTKPSTGIPKSDLASAVQTSLNKADSALQAESDPTVPAWAKQPSKPSYTKSEVGLGNVANERQYSSSNPPPYPVVPNGNYQNMTVGNASKLGGKTAEQIRTKVFRTNKVLNTTVDGFTLIDETAVVEPDRTNVVAGDIFVDANNTVAVATEDFDSGTVIFTVQTRSSVPIATTSVLGKVKSSTTGTTSGRDYKVQVNTDGTMKVNVPWTDNNIVTNIGANNTGYTSGNINFVGSGATSVSKSGSTVTISSTNTNTTYSFSNGLDGSFTVTPSGGQAQKVSIGTPAAATKATQDGNGNNIVNTYATKSQVNKTSMAPNTYGSRITVSVTGSPITYTAPSNGYLVLKFHTTAAYQYVNFQNRTAGLYDSFPPSYSNNAYCNMYMAARKGDSIWFSFTVKMDEIYFVPAIQI
ncbi:hypothetical protein [uncultured Coprobacter sp.]|uniref:hypothetical protein n=1 Tax=uncultured Coprobacter sp. TaxID=1720550 RepID=UPI00261B9E3E|nr:hypothetical protein [uncultured Coprobacter sp.]